jgi:hypothetical protein
MVWSFFGNGRGKGVHDGVGVILKQEIRKEQLTMDSQCLQNVADVVVFFVSKNKLRIHEAYSNVKRDISRYFHLIKPENVDRHQVGTTRK